MTRWGAGLVRCSPFFEFRLLTLGSLTLTLVPLSLTKTVALFGSGPLELHYRVSA